MEIGLKLARQAAGLTQAQAAELVYLSTRAWQYLEAGQTQNKAAIELFLIKTREMRK